MTPEEAAAWADVQAAAEKLRKVIEAELADMQQQRPPWWRRWLHLN